MDWGDAVRGFSRISVVFGDITELRVGAIVNAANSSLLGGGGVDGAIHRAAGPDLFDECEALGGCETGEARLTAGYDLPSRYVIHAVGPVYHGGHSGEPALLRSAYESALRLATDEAIDSVAFPCISTGVYGYPKSAACEVALDAVSDWLDSHEFPREVVFCCFETEDFELYTQRLG